MKLKLVPFSLLLSPALTLLAAGNAAAALADEPANVTTQTELAVSDKWYERSFEQLLKTKIITSTREEQDIGLSPNNVSVYSAAEIKRMGIRSIKELLERTTGFFMNHQVGGPAIGSRGFIGDNEQFLLLIDGHSQNSIVDKGAGNYFLFPFLEHVERVEILRGPGSTLWGSDAALGIIHIITKDGKGLEGVTASYSLASADNYQYANVRTGKQLADNINYMFSATTARSDGFLTEPVDYMPESSRWEKLENSYDIYLKAQLDDITFYARSADMRNQRPIGSIVNSFYYPTYPLFDVETRRQHNYLDIHHQKQLNEQFKLETRFFSDMIQGFQAQTNPTLNDDAYLVEESAGNKESSLGLEMLGRWQASNSHKVLLGWRAVQTEIDPVTNGILYPATADPSNTTNIRSLRVVPDGYDRNLAVFIEDDWSLHESVNIIFGIRVDANSLREDNTIYLPRFAFNWRIDNAWTAQYSYTTGYIRPPVGIGFLGQEQYNTNLSAPTGKIYGAQESEEVFNHDFRIAYNRDPLSIKWNLYHTYIDNSFNFIYEPEDVNTLERILFYVNTNKIETYGNELEFNFVPSDRWNLYGNYSYVMKARLDDMTGEAFGIKYDMGHTWFDFGEGAFTKNGDIVGYPNKMWNFGINVFLSEQLSTNLHYRGWSDMQMRKRNTIQVVGESDRSYGPEHFVDLNFRYEDIEGTNLDVGFFVKNLLNNDHSEIGMLYFSQVWTDRRRSIGVDISYTF